VYFLLVLRIITLRNTLIALCISGLPLIGLVCSQYLEEGIIGSLLAERFGSLSNIGPNLISSLLDLLFPVTLFLAIKEKRRLPKISLSALSAFYGIILFATSSRGSMPGLLAIAVYLTCRSKSIKSVIIIIIAAIALGWIFGTKTVARIVTPERGDLISNLGRVEMLRAGFKLLKDNHYLYGIGMNNFRFEKFKYGFPKWFDVGSKMSSHDTHFEIWVGWGFFGLVGWLYLWIGIHTARIKPSSENAYLKAPLILAMIGFLAHGFFDSFIALFPFLMILFCLLACISYAVYLDRVKTEKAPGQAPYQPT
jgi:hypothetical protein